MPEHIHISLCLTEPHVVDSGQAGTEDSYLTLYFTVPHDALQCTSHSVDRTSTHGTPPHGHQVV